MQLIQCLKDIANRIKAEADYITEYYSKVVSGRKWYITKYKSGKVVLECRFNTTSSVTLGTSYASDEYYSIQTWTIPDVIDDIEDVTVLGNIRGNGIDRFARGELTSSNTLKFYWCNATSYTASAGVEISIRIVSGGAFKRTNSPAGRWHLCCL